MPQIYVQKKSSAGKEIQCGRCGTKIAAGMKYRSWSFRYGGKHVRCMEPHCSPRASELTQSKASGMHELNERMEEILNPKNHEWTVESLGSLIDDIDSVKDDADSLRDEIQDGFDNMGEGLQQSDAGQSAESRIEALDTYIQELDSAIYEQRSEIENIEPEADVKDIAERVIDAFAGIELEVE